MSTNSIYTDYQDLFDRDFDHIAANITTLPTEELESALRDAWMLAGGYASKSVTQKTFMNSIYGATSNKYYPMCNINGAADITSEGRFYIRFAADGTNAWLLNRWHTLTDLHKTLRTYKVLDKEGNVEYDFTGRFDKEEVTPLDNIDYVLYIDTDSIYVELRHLVASIGYTGEPVYFIKTLNELALAPMFNKILGDKVAERSGENFLKFDLENISAKAFFSAKKKYLCALAWEDSKNIVFDNPAEHIKGKGIELAQNSFTKPVLGVLKFLLAKLVSGELNKTTYHAYMHAVFNKFKQFPLQEKCKYINVSQDKYDEYITKCDAEGYAWGSGALMQFKGAARHNHLLHKNPELKQKYDFVAGKLGIYLDEQGIPFAFAPFEFPHEIAPPINDKIQFMKLIVSPINRLVILADINVEVDIFSEFQQKSL